MRISKIRIRNFRNIGDLNIDFHGITAICGPNSCGKTNLLQAIDFAFRSDISHADVYANLPRDLRDVRGAPLLSIWLDFELESCPKAIGKLAGLPKSPNIAYQFRAVRTGRVTRRLGKTVLEEKEFEQFSKLFSIVYVPPIRDLSGDGIDPFKKVLSDALRRARGTSNMSTARNAAVKILDSHAVGVLAEPGKIAKRMLGSSALNLDTDSVDLDDLYEATSLSVKVGQHNIPLAELGTGHQSAMILQFYRQMGQLSGAECVFLFEEPDNHLHPSMIGMISRDLRELSNDYQVILTTHSPLLLQDFDFAEVVALSNQGGEVGKRDIDMSHYSPKEAKHVLRYYGIKAWQPLLCKRIIAVEGAIDAAILKSTIEVRCGRTSEELDIEILAAGGKPKVLELCKLFSALRVDWLAVLDWDAALSDEVPLTKLGLDSKQRGKALYAVLQTRAALDGSMKRGRKAIDGLDRIRAELVSGRKEPSVFAGSFLESYLSALRLLTKADTQRLRTHLEAKQRRKYSNLLRKANVFLWSGTIEEVLLSNTMREEEAESFLIARGLLSKRIENRRKEKLMSTIHSMAHLPDELARMVERLESKGLLSYSELHAAEKQIVSGL